MMAVAVCAGNLALKKVKSLWIYEHFLPYSSDITIDLLLIAALAS